MYHRPSGSRGGRDDWNDPMIPPNSATYTSSHPLPTGFRGQQQQPPPSQVPPQRPMMQHYGESDYSYADNYYDEKDSYHGHGGGGGGYAESDAHSYHSQSPLRPQPSNGNLPTFNAATATPGGYQHSLGPPPTSYPPQPSPPTHALPLQYRPTVQRKKIPLITGPTGHPIFRLNAPVPSQVKGMLPNGMMGKGLGEEVEKMRYTAVTCEPDEFVSKGYSLRAQELGRKNELCIVLTMYNEDEFLFTRTMSSVIKNIQHLQSRKNSKTWGNAPSAANGEAWKKVVVVVVSDGRTKINARTLKVLGMMGCYQEGIPKDTVVGKDVHAHVFEYTTTVNVDQTGQVSSTGVPIQMVFCLKEQNKKKLNSHRWFFNAFCRCLNPNVCILIDVGTKPSGTSIYQLWKAFDKDAGVGGACGEITVDTGRGCSALINPLVAAQNFEYKMSNILDKPLESVFGYISVLPGAFSAYRYRALLNNQKGNGPLATYFVGEKFHEPGYTAGIFESNLYLAEDRVLCFEIVTKKREAWKLKYVKSAKASTDVPDSLPEFISQRRRWLNGSFFAAVHATFMFYKIWTSGQNIFRMLWLQLEFLYNAWNLLFSWISLGNFYLAFFFLTQSATSDDADKDPFGGAGDEVAGIINQVYIALLFVILICALGNRPQGSRLTYLGVVMGFGILFCVALYCAGWSLWLAVPHDFAGWEDVKKLLDTSAFRNILISLLSTYGLYLFSSIIHFEPWHMITSFVQYMLLLPSFVNVLNIYSFSNLHDVSWGTKGQAGPAKDLGGAKSGADGKDMVEVDIPTVPADIDAMWTHMRKEMGVKQVEQHTKRDAATKQEDHYRNFRTNVVLLYFGTNMGLVLFFTSKFFQNWVKNTLGNSGGNVNPYMVFIFWSVAGTSLIRFVFSTWYLILRLFGW